jgi:hypothetical protein
MHAGQLSRTAGTLDVGELKIAWPSRHSSNLRYAEASQSTVIRYQIPPNFIRLRLKRIRENMDIDIGGASVHHLGFAGGRRAG